jgi:hypothetical protein
MPAAGHVGLRAAALDTPWLVAVVQVGSTAVAWVVAVASTAVAVVAASTAAVVVDTGKS